MYSIDLLLFEQFHIPYLEWKEKYFIYQNFTKKL